MLHSFSPLLFPCLLFRIVMADDSDSVIVTVTGDDNQSALFGKYDLGQLLGVGAFAKVYQADDLRTGDSVAIKVVNKRRLKGGLTAHIKREISVMRRLRHPHIVRLFEVLATKTKIYFVMELAKGGELFSRVKSSRFTENLSRKYFRQLISAVRYCHARGVFHRDLKPENLLLDENRDLKVSDFGLSAMREQIKSDGMLHTLCGTPAYVAPELLLKKGYDGSKTDIWSCGVVLFLLNSGYLPFSDPNITGLYRKIHKAQFKMPEWTSPDLRRLLKRLLDPNPDKRITVDEILQDPWFNQGVDPNEVMRVHTDDYDIEEKGKKLNAFDIISSSSYANLSGLFHNFVTPDHCDQFISDETPAEILGKVEELANQLNLRIAKKKESGVKLEGPRGAAANVVVVKLHGLTDDLVMVEIKNKQRDVGLVWADALRQRLRSLVNQPAYRVPPG